MGLREYPPFAATLAGGFRGYRSEPLSSDLETKPDSFVTVAEMVLTGVDEQCVLPRLLDSSVKTLPGNQPIWPHGRT